jgi:hypothetical protein
MAAGTKVVTWDWIYTFIEFGSGHSTATTGQNCALVQFNQEKKGKEENSLI